MSALEHEIIEKFHQLQPAAQQRVLALLEQGVVSDNISEFDYATWFENVEALRQQIRVSNGAKLPPIDVVGMLHDIRDGEDE